MREKADVRRQRPGANGQGGSLTSESWASGQGLPGVVSGLACTLPYPHRYSAEGFIDKNRDSLFQDIKRLLYNR